MEEGNILGLELFEGKGINPVQEELKPPSRIGCRDVVDAAIDVTPPGSWSGPLFRRFIQQSQFGTDMSHEEVFCRRERTAITVAKGEGIGGGKS
jgi:hypothetical protein